MTMLPLGQAESRGLETPGPEVFSVASEGVGHLLSDQTEKDIVASHVSRL